MNSKMVICLQCSKYKLTKLAVYVSVQGYTRIIQEMKSGHQSRVAILSFHVIVVTFGLHGTKSTTKGF